MGLLQVAAVSALGYFGYRYWQKKQVQDSPAFAQGQSAEANFSKVRDAGPKAMRDRPDSWGKVDEESDQSFPASDPPANY